MADDQEKFLSRWSRLKGKSREQAGRAEAPKPESPADAKAPPPELPPVGKLDFDSDYRGFLHPKIDEDTRRAALKKLFSDARFNVIDEMDIDIEDYSKYAPLPAAVVASLKQTQDILRWARERKEEEQRRERRLAEGDSAPAERRDAHTHPESAQAPAGTGQPEAQRATPAAAAPEQRHPGPEDADAKKA